MAHHRRPRSRVAGMVAALALAFTLSVAGCTDSATPAASSSPSPTVASPTATPEPSPSRSAAPQRPATMDRDDVEGAIAAAQYFLELYPYAYNTGDLTEWKALSHPECIFCASVVEGVEKLHASGGYETGGEIVLESASGELDGSGARGRVRLRVLQSEVLRLDSAGRTIETNPGGRFDFEVIVTEPTRWSIRGVSVEAVT